MSKQIKQVLNERKNTHGSFSTHSEISQSLKDIIKLGPSYNKLSKIQKEGLEMILHKVARAVNGDTEYIDNYIDIAGYAQLIINDMQD